MNKTFTYLLACALPTFIACKKDAKPTIFSGVVLYQADRSPVANALVGLSLTTVDNQSRPHSGYTDNKGAYAIEVNEGALRDEYFTVALKKGMVQIRENWKRSRADLRPDTILLDDASYLHIEVKVSLPASQGYPGLIWDFLKPAAPAVIGGAFYREMPLQNLPSGTTRQVLDSFAYAEHDRAYARLYAVKENTPSYLVDREIALKRKDTTYLKIEY